MSALRKVLVVDDDPVVGTSFSRVLSDKGYTVITAENGAEALEKLQKERVDLVYTDIKMPGMSGLEVAERVRERQPWTPVVIVTGYGSTANQQRAKAAGVSEFLHKPLSPEMIEQSAYKALHEAPLPEPVTPVVPVEQPTAPAVAEAAVESGEVAKPHLLRNMALFLSAPFIGLLYAVLLPFVGMGMLAWTVAQPMVESDSFRRAARSTLGFGKAVVQLMLAPFVGLAFVLLFPFFGLALLALTVGKALTGRVHTE